ncbi:MAG TPA: helix-turn-helix transcriptional regulator [bacterium]
MKNANFIQALGLNIRKFRKAKGLTQEQLAELAGISYKYLGEIERGETNPSIGTLLVIAQGLNVSLNHIIKFESEKHVQQKGKRYAESHPDFLVSDNSAKIVPGDEKKQKLIIQAIKLLKRAFS